LPAGDTPEAILGLLLNRVAGAAPHAGRLEYADLRRACAGVEGLPRPGLPPFHVFSAPTEAELYAALHMPAMRVRRFVERPELTAVLDATEGLLVVGRPGSGKSHALIKLALAQPDWSVAVVDRHFRADDLSRLMAQLRRLPGRYQLLWDDVHEKPALFADAVQRLWQRGDDVRVLAAYRQQYAPGVRECITPELCRRVGIRARPLRLLPFDRAQAARMAQTVAESVDLSLDPAACEAFARHIWRGDGGPLFALSTGLLLQEGTRQGEPIRAAHVEQLPEDLLAVWRYLYERLASRPDGLALQAFLDLLGFLHRINCPLDARLVELLYVEVLGHSAGTFDAVARLLEQEGWLRAEEDFVAHDLTLEAVPQSERLFSRILRFASRGAQGEQLPLGLLRGSLSNFYAGQVPTARTGAARREAALRAMRWAERAIEDFRIAGYTPYLAMSLNNASNRYSDLAGLEETRAGRVALLERAVAAIEEAVGVFRALGIARYLIVALVNALRHHMSLANEMGRLDLPHLRTLCAEGERLSAAMEDAQRRQFFRRVGQELEDENDAG